MKLLPLREISLPPDLQFLAAHQRVLLIAGAAFLAVVALWLLFVPRGKSPIVARLGSLVWKRNQFCRGWLITGDTGSGKTSSGINQIAHQVFQNEPRWGGLCIDEKGVYWETLAAMARHYGRESDLIHLQIREDEPGFVFGGLFSPESIALGSNLTLTVHSTNAAPAAIRSSLLDLGNARLNLTFPPSLPPGETILIAQYALDSLTGQFANLPEGAVTNIAGRDWEIHYAVERPGENSDTRFITLSAPAAAPRFTSIERLPSGDVILTGTASPGATVNIETSKILDSFVFIGSAVANGTGQFTFTDSNPAFDTRFYRAANP